MGTNIGPWKAMEHWAPKDTPGVINGHQTHWPVGGSGYAMSKKGMKKGIPGSDRDGIKRKQRGSAIMAIKSRIRAKKMAYHAGGKKGAAP